MRNGRGRFLRRDGGFTLVELLVTIGIIAVLLAIIMPAIVRGREQAKRAACLSNLRQIGMGTIEYARNNGGDLPRFSTWLPYFASYNNPSFWVRDARPLLAQITNNPGAYYCPSGEITRSDSGLDDPWNQFNAAWDEPNRPGVYYRVMGYSLVGLFDFEVVGWCPVQIKHNYLDLPAPAPDKRTNLPSRLSGFRNPAEIALGTDAQRATNPLAGYGVAYPGYNGWTGPSYLFPHRKWLVWEGTNTVFFDGHAEWRHRTLIFKPDQPPYFGARYILWQNQGFDEEPYWW